MTEDKVEQEALKLGLEPVELRDGSGSLLTTGL